MGAARGCFFVLEGLDRAGKSTQASMLAQHLRATLQADVKEMKFPDRTTQTGQLISKYLADGMAMEDHAIHLLFSANRWESKQNMEDLLKGGTHLVVDRYAFSGVAYSAAKGLSREWCASVDEGLLAPDAVLFLKVDPEAAGSREGYGEERYEQVALQKKVGSEFAAMQDARFHFIDGAREIDTVHTDIKAIASDVVQRCQQMPLDLLWSKPKE